MSDKVFTFLWDFASVFDRIEEKLWGKEQGLANGLKWIQATALVSVMLEHMHDLPGLISDCFEF